MINTDFDNFSDTGEMADGLRFRGPNLSLPLSLSLSLSLSPCGSMIDDRG